MARPTREYSRQFTPAADSDGSSFSMHRIPTALLIQVKAKAKREGVSIRAMLLKRMQRFLKEKPKAAKGRVQ